MLNQKEIEELAVNKYLVASKQSFEIEVFESPDFILKKKSKAIKNLKTTHSQDLAHF